jgi:hypothetical protein
MKQKRQLLPGTHRISGKRIVLVMVCLLWGPALMAQGSNQGQEEDPVQVYIKSHPESQLVKYAVQQPDDIQVPRMLKYAMITENPEMYPELSSSDIQRMHHELKQFNEKMNFVNEQVAHGVTPEMARVRYERTVSAQQGDGSAPRPSNPGVSQGSPMLMAPSDQ